MSSMAGAAPGGSTTQTQTVPVSPLQTIMTPDGRIWNLESHQITCRQPTTTQQFPDVLYLVYRSEMVPGDSTTQPQTVLGPSPQTIMTPDGRIWTFESSQISIYHSSTTQPSPDTLHLMYESRTQGKAGEYSEVPRNSRQEKGKDGRDGAANEALGQTEKV